MQTDSHLQNIHQKRLLEDLGHAHAHSHEKLRQYSYEAASEIRRLQNEVDKLRNRSFLNRLFNRN